MITLVRILWTVLLFSGFNTFVYGQLLGGAEVSYIKYTGIHGFVFKPTVGIDLQIGTGDGENPISFIGSVGFYQLPTRMDTFPSYGYATDQNGLTVLLPTKDIYENYFVIPIGGRIEWLPLSSNIRLPSKVRPTIGLGMYYYATFGTHISDFYPIINSRENALQTMGVVPRIGLLAEMSQDIDLQLGIARNIAINEKMVFESYWKLSAGVLFY